MTIGHNLSEFYGKPVEEFDVSKGLVSPRGVAYRARLDWEAYEEGKSIIESLDAMAAAPNASDLLALVVGAWDFEGGDSVEVCKWLINNAPNFPALEALMFGDITYEEQEISWIEQSDVGPVLMAFPNLRHFQVRGGHGLSFSDVRHPRLETLIIETGGLPTSVIREVIQADLPQLKHLELWLGSRDYGFDADVEELRPILSGGRWPRLEHLGLRDSEITDEIAEALDVRLPTDTRSGAEMDAPRARAAESVLDTLKVLDLSMGTLSDRGAAALLENEKILALERLDLHYHYMSDEWADRFRELDLNVDVSDQQTADRPDRRYVAVAE